MRILLRVVLYFAIVSWLGAELFFPVLAQITFTTLGPEKHVAGEIVGSLLAIVHHEGLVCAIFIALGLMGAARWKLYPRIHIRTLLTLVVLMLAITVVSEHAITPSMRAYRLAAGGNIDFAPPNDPNRIAFERLHRKSEMAEMAIDLFGIAFVVVVAVAESKPPIGAPS